MEKLVLDVVVNEGRNNYISAKEDPQKNKIPFRTAQRLKQSLIHDYITYQIKDQTTLKWRKFS